MTALGTRLRMKALLTAEGPALVAGGPLHSDMTRDWIARILAVPVVANAEANELHRSAQAAPDLSPNDPITARHSWSFDLIRTQGAWAHTRGDPSIVVAVIDTGVGLSGNPHPDLEGQLLPGWDFVDDDSQPTDVAGANFHGTHVAGTVAARANNGYGVAGIAPGVRLLPVRAGGGDGAFSSFDIAGAIRWSAGLPVSGAPSNPNPARIINMSFGGAQKTAIETDAIRAASNAGVILIAAAGNDAGAVLYPAAHDEVIAVSAVGPSADRASYSNHGSSVEVAAPGGSGGYADNNVWSTVYDRGDSSPTFQGYPGTSMASPHVAAVAALCLSANPSLTAGQVRSILQSTAIDLGGTGRDSYYGFGLVDAQAAVEKALELAASPPPAAPEKLTARTTHLRLTTTSPSGTLRFSNTGDGVTRVQTVRVFGLEAGRRVADPGWLTAQVSKADATGSTDALVAVTASSSGSSLRQGLLEVSGDGGIVTVPVLFSPETVPDLGVVKLYVVDPVTWETVGFTTTSLSESYDFRVEGVPPGEYFVIALVDEDGDDDLSRPDEWFGAFPSLDWEIVSLSEGETRSGLGIPLFQPAEWIDTGTGGGSVTGVQAVIVRDKESGLPLEGARVVLGNRTLEAITDDRGVAVFQGVVGAQTVTAIAAGYDAETYVQVNATEIGFELARTNTEETEVEVDVTVSGLLTDEYAELFLGTEFVGEIPWNDADNTTTIRVSKPGILNVMVWDSAAGYTLAAGWEEITPATMAAQAPWVGVWVDTLPSWTTMGVDVDVTPPGFDVYALYPCVVGDSLEEILMLGWAATLSADERLITSLIDWPALDYYPGSILVLGANSTNTARSLRVVNDTVGGFYGALWTVPLAQPPTLLSPADDAVIREGERMSFDMPWAPTTGSLTLTHESSGFEWRLKFGSGATSVILPAVGLLASGTWTWQVDAADIAGVTYETMSSRPSDLAESLSSIDWFVESETRRVTVP